MPHYGYFLNTRPLQYLPAALAAGAAAFTIIDSNEHIAAAEMILAERPDAKVVFRYHAPNGLSRPPAEYARWCYHERYRHHAHLSKMFFYLNEPQIENDGYNPEDYNSMRALWVRLNTYCMVFVDEFRRLAPDAFIIFPPPAPGVFWDDYRNVSGGIDGIDICRPAWQKHDAIAQNNYWPNDHYGLLIDSEWYAFRYRKTWIRTAKPIWVSEYNGDVNQAGWLDQQVYYLRQAARDPYLIGTTCFLLGGEPNQFEQHNIARRQNVANDLLYIGQKVKEVYNQMANTETIRNAAWQALPRPIAYNPAAAFPKKARELGLGVPVTAEGTAIILSTEYAWQGFSGGVLYCVKGDWGNISTLLW